MSAENKKIPDWAQQERQQDMDWIRENAGLFQLAAAIAYEDSGRGAIVVDTTTQPVPGIGHPFGYFDQETVGEDFDEDTKRMVQNYEPTEENVIVLLKQERRSSTYRIKMLSSDDLPGVDHSQFGN